MKLKKIILFLLLTSSLFAEAKLYFGANYGIIEESFLEDIDAESSSNIASIKAGYGVREAYAIEISLEYRDNKAKIFSSDSDTDFDGDKYGMNINLVKAFDFDIYALPYIKAGFGSGFFEVERILQNRLFYSSFNLGTGIFIPIDESLDFEIGYEYKYISYESLDTIAEQINYQSNSNIAYFGFNARF